MNQLGESIKLQYQSLARAHGQFCSLLPKELRKQINREREDVGVVVLACNGVEGLQVAQLEGRW